MASSKEPTSRFLMMAPSDVPASQSVINILISTDNHLGYLERDPVRGDDSFRAFEEVLGIANANKVDMLLLAGDLFHDNKPSRSTIVRTMQLLRRACLSPSGDVRLAVRSDPAQVNYMNPNLSVSLPVFVIHGNHDDPTGAQALSALDVLSEAGLVTYFGKMPNSKRLQVSPILLQKGRTALALYGIGNIRDEVLYQTWAKEHNVKWLSPMSHPATHHRERHLPDTDSPAAPEDLRWFNLLAIHQNRVTRGSSKGISESLLPPWLDFVVWGHEHDSHPDVTRTSPPVVQPGSTVATSLSMGESRPKHAILLKVHRGKFKPYAVPLHSVRSFRFLDVALSEQTGVSDTDPKSVVAFLEDTVTEMATQLEIEFDNKLTSLAKGTLKVEGVEYPPSKFYSQRMTPTVRQPLIRLRVETSGNYEVPNPRRQSFVGRVASASDVLLFYRSRRHLKRTRTVMQGRTGEAGAAGDNEGGDLWDDEEGAMLSQNGESRDVVQIPKLVQYYLYHSKAGGAGLRFLEFDKLTGAVDLFVNKMEGRAIVDYVSSFVKLIQDKTLDQATKEGVDLDETKLAEQFKAGANEAAKRVLQELAEKKADAQAEAGVKSNKEDSHKNAQGGEAQRKSGEDMGEEGNGAGPSDGGGCQQNKRDGAGNEGEKVEEEMEGERVEELLDDVHAVLTANPKMAAAIQQAEDSGKSDESDENDEDEITPAVRSRGSTAGRGQARGRAKVTRGGRGKAKTRGIDSYLKKAGGDVAASSGRRGAAGSSVAAASASAAAPVRRSGRRVVTRNASMMVDDSDDEEESGQRVDEDAVVVEESDEEKEEYVPVGASTRKRKVRGAASSAGRASQRVKTESIAAGGSGSARKSSAFAGRARARRNTATIDVGEESGDDAM